MAERRDALAAAAELILAIEAAALAATAARTGLEVTFPEMIEESLAEIPSVAPVTVFPLIMLKLPFSASMPMELPEMTFSTTVQFWVTWMAL